LTEGATLDVDAFLRLTPRGPKLCKICGAVALAFGELDFNRSCATPESVVLPASGMAIEYNRCPDCGFLFSAAFDGWTSQEFLEKIYNEQYLAVDPDYVERRPAASATFLAQLFSAAKASLSVLDYGGGNGALARQLRQSGFAAADTYDPLVGEFARLPDRKYPIVCCFETLEHTPDPLAAMAEMAKLLDEPGIIVFSTVVQPADIQAQGLGWWYAGPRNGHISLFSRKSMERAWRKTGLRFGSFDNITHVAFRAIPDFARHLFPAS
jgi:2-polyprenyl-6-hydroxyphenyl methylase/3-demethylubiquinone-9 3-methyltransferase